MVRIVAVVVALGACSPAQAPRARHVGEALSLGGVTGLVGTALASPHIDHDGYFISTFSVMSVLGIAIFAAGELATPEPIRETRPERNHRWAQILTERAAGAARDGRCRRVRHLETRVRYYDREIHDFVFMRDPEILKCMNPEPDPAAPVVPVRVPVVLSGSS